MSSIKARLLSLGKVVVGTAALLGLVWMVGLAQPDGTIKESHADILDLDMVKLSTSARFSRGLDRLDHPEPRTFELNGNMVHFSTRESRKRPEQLMLEYQEEFVRQGVNEKVWDAEAIREEPDQMMFQGMTGSVIPFQQNRNYARLGGVIPANGVDDPDDAAKLESLAEGVERPRDLFKGHHSIEMFWDEQRRKSRVTASWSDDFDYGKAVGDFRGDENASVDPDMPACPGCNRLKQLREVDGPGAYSSNIYTGRRDRDQMLNFYRRVLPRRGWQETEASNLYQAARPYVRHQGDQADMIQFAKGNRFITVLAYPDEYGETTVHLVKGQ